MSHTTEIKNVVFSDVEALRLAVADLNKAGVKCTLAENSTARGYFSNQTGMDGVWDYVLKMDNCPYDIAFCKREGANEYVARTDLYGGSVASVLGVRAKDSEDPNQAALGKLYQAYAINAATRQAIRQGYTVRRVAKPDGSVQLIVNAN